jgi:hypothetical protein
VFIGFGLPALDLLIYFLDLLHQGLGFGVLPRLFLFAHLFRQGVAFVSEGVNFRQGPPAIKVFFQKVVKSDIQAPVAHGEFNSVEIVPDKFYIQHDDSLEGFLFSVFCKKYQRISKKIRA